MKGCCINMAQCNLPECQIDHKVDKNTLKEHNRIAENRFKNSSHTDEFGSISNVSNSFVIPEDVDEDDLEDYYYDQAEESLENIDFSYGTIYYEGYEPSRGDSGSQDFLMDYAATKASEQDDSQDRVIVSFQIPGDDDDALQANSDYLEDFPDSENGIKGEVNGDNYTYTFDNFDHLNKNKHVVEQMSNMITNTHEDYPVFSDEYYNNVVNGYEDEREMQREVAYEYAEKDFYEGEGHKMLVDAVRQRVESSGHSFNEAKFEEWYDSYEAEGARLKYYDANGSYEMFFPDEETGETVIQKNNFDSFFNKYGNDYVQGYMSSDDSIVMEGLRNRQNHKEYTAEDIKNADNWSDEDLARFFNQ